MKVYELAKKLNVTNNELISIARRAGVEVKGPASVLDEKQIEQIKMVMDKEKGLQHHSQVVESRVSSRVIRRRVIEERKVEPVKEAEISAVEQDFRKEGISEIKVEEMKIEQERLVEQQEHVEEQIAELKEVREEVEEEKPSVVEKEWEEIFRDEEIKETEEKIEEHIIPAPVAESGEKIIMADDVHVEIEKEEEKITRKKKVVIETKEREELFKGKKKVFVKKKEGRVKENIFEELVDHLEDRKEELVEDTGKEESFFVPLKKKKTAIEPSKKQEAIPVRATKRVIKIDQTITVGELSKSMGVKVGDIIKRLMSMGLMATINQPLDADTATLIASEFGYDVERTSIEIEDIYEAKIDREEDLKPRSPVVTVMGHVDHGKTSLLDAIRKTNIIAQEAGGITQHIGAYLVKLDDGREVVFLDTPGHEAFTAMRARGAKVTDIVVLVVAADDGVMPQTIEAINHARAAKVPIVVAINKIDKPNANPEKVKRVLSEYGLVPEEWGGDTLYAEVSAKMKKGIRELLEIILLQADVLELKANPDKPARGTIIEAKLDRGRGPVATVLVQEGTLRVGDVFVAGLQYGKVRAMINDKGNRIESAYPSCPVEVIGFNGIPAAGDPFVVVKDERRAKEIAYLRQIKQREKELAKSARITLEEFYRRIKEGVTKEMNLILKADAQGSIEAIADALKKLTTEEVRVNIIHSSVGAISESDVMLAVASDAIIIGFNVKIDQKAQSIASQEKVDIRIYSVIYDAISDIKKALVGLLEPVVKEVYIGRAEVRETFNISKVGVVAGSYVLEGKVMRNASVRVIRDGAVIHEGRVASLKRFKEDVKEVAAGYECGILIENFNQVKAGDILEIFTLEKTSPTI